MSIRQCGCDSGSSEPCHSNTTTAGSAIRCVIAGNANCGKSTLFMALSGQRASVGNWSGVTVDQKAAHFKLGHQAVELIDLPGFQDLDAEFDDGMIDETISQQEINNGNYDLLINLVDATQLERSLYLTLQLRELGVPMLVVLNKAELASLKSLEIDTKQLSQLLNCRVIAISAKSASNIDQLRQHIVSAASAAQLPALSIPLADAVELELAAIELPKAQAVKSLLYPADTQSQQAVNRLTANDIDLQEHLVERRYQFIERLYQRCVQSSATGPELTEVLDKFALSFWTGVPLFFGVMYLTFMFAINVGAAFIDFFDILAGALFVDGAGELLTSIGSPQWLTTIVAGGVGAGIQTVATFIPVVAFLYIALSILEISGYLARAGFVIEGLMQKIGLPGKAFVPLIVGFGCNVPSITATRTLGSYRERVVTAMMAPFMSCGARLPVYALFAAAFFPENGQNLVFALYLAGIAAAILTGLLLRYTLLPGQASQGIMELPDYELPTLSAVMRRTWQRTKQFVLGAGKMIVIVVTILSFVNSIGTDGSFGNEDSEHSVLSKASQLVTPVFTPMGIQDENWPATVGIVTGIFAKEAVVGTLNSLYSQSATDEGAELNLLSSFNEALSTIPDNLFGIAWEDPLSLNIGDVKDTQSMAEEFGFETGTLQNLQARFYTQAAAFSYLLFILLYTPCAAVLGAMANEFGNRWTLFSAVYTFGLAYAVATLFYQLSQFAETPVRSASYIGIIVALCGAAVWYLRQLGQQPKKGVGDIAVLIRE